MNKLKATKWLGLIAALATALVSIVAGDYVTGVGIAAAAFSSASTLANQ